MGFVLTQKKSNIVEKKNDPMSGPKADQTKDMIDNYLFIFKLFTCFIIWTNLHIYIISTVIQYLQEEQA